jgi:hypothetical protein
MGTTTLVHYENRHGDMCVERVFNARVKPHTSDLQVLGCDILAVIPE